ncbi:MAG TPA: ComEC/Rec2 family competence protein [bacterium]|nr:ComEC/Rec2 family competence protein [bacterium]
MIESKSWIFLTLFTAGIITQKFIPLPQAYLVPLFVFSAIVFLILAIKFEKISTGCLIAFIFIAGIFCSGQSGIGYEKQIPFFPEKVKAITGEITDVREKGMLIVVTIENTSFSNGSIWIKSGLSVKTSLPLNKPVYDSDWILIDTIKSINIEHNQLIVSAGNWKIIEPQSIYGRFRYKTQILTETITKKWFRYHAQAAAIFQMIVLGNSRQSLDVKNIFIQTGTYHLLIVSGIHLGYLLFFLKLVVFPLRRFEQTHYKIFNLFYLVAIIFYSAITGFNTPVVRAALMFGIYIFSEMIERPVTGLDSIGWAGSIILFSNPANLFNMGFQLSFTATTGIVLTMKNIPAIKKVPSWLDSMIRANVGAQVFTLPVLVGNIGTFYPMGLIANFFLVPFGGVVVGLGFVFLITIFLRNIIIWPLIKSIDLFWIATKLFSRISPAVYWNPGIPVVIIMYLFILAVVFRNQWKLFTISAVLATIACFVCNPVDKKSYEKQIYPVSEAVGSITIFPCNKMLCMIEKHNCILVILSMEEDGSTLNPAIKKIKTTGKDAVFMFIDCSHDIFEALSILMSQIKPLAVIDNMEIRKHPAFGYRIHFMLGQMDIKQQFWNFLVPFEGVRVIYSGKNSIVLEYKTINKTIIISTHLNANIFEILPFSPRYDTIYATDIALSKKLAGYLDEYETKQLIYQKIIYYTIKQQPHFQIIRLSNKPVVIFP